MTNYSENPGSCEIVYFKPSGKYYMTEAIDMSDEYDTLSIHDAVRNAIVKARGSDMAHFTRVVLEPYHRNAYPIMLVAEEEW